MAAAKTQPQGDKKEAQGVQALLGPAANGNSRRKAPQKPRATDRLPFVRDAPSEKRGTQRRNFWAVEEIGEDVDGNRLGAEFAQETLAVMRECGLPVLNWIIMDMIAAGRFGEVEIGFIQAIGDAAAHGLIR